MPLVREPVPEQVREDRAEVDARSERVTGLCPDPDRAHSDGCKPDSCKPDDCKPDVVRASSVSWNTLRRLFQPYGLTVEQVPDQHEIPGSHWGDDEAGLIASTLYARSDTPLHSILHEAGHWLLMEPRRRTRLHTDAGGSSSEENAVCYLQILMADRIDGYSSERMLLDMDRWGYSFRLGSARRWFEQDADDALQALIDRLPNLGSAERPFDVARLGRSR